MINRLNEKCLTATVTDLYWERIFLHMMVKVDVLDETILENGEPLAFYMVDRVTYDCPVKCKVLGEKDGVYHLRINVTNNGENRCIPEGVYILEVCQKNMALADAQTDISVVPKLEDCSRNFLYRKGIRVYTATFAVEEGTDDLPFQMTTMASLQIDMSFPEHATMRERIHLIQDLKATWFSKKNMIRNAYHFLHFMYRKSRPKTVLFMTEQSDKIASNLKAVSERMVERGLDKEYTILVSARSSSERGQTIKSWLDFTVKLARSGIVFLDDHAPCLDWLELSKDTKVIQLWHAGAGFKSSGYSRWGHMGCPNAVSCHRQYSFGIAGSKNIAPFFSEVWGMNDEQVLATGMPRMDEYLEEEHKQKKIAEIYEQYPMCKGKKVILFAPTYRGMNKREAHYPYHLVDFEGLYRVCGDEYVVLFKMHPWVRKKVPIAKEFADRFIDVGKYPNINDLFYVTDLLITDYSSNIFEYSLMKNPMLFFAFDKIQYSFSRGFHREYEESAPGKVCYTFEQLLEAIAKKDFEEEKVQQYVDHHFDYIDTHSSDRVIDWLVLGNLPLDVVNDLKRVEEENAYRNSLDFTFGGERVPLMELIEERKKEMTEMKRRRRYK